MRWSSLAPRALAAALLLSIWIGSAAQYDWPSKPIKILVPWPPGGSSDNLARVVGERLARQLSQAVVVENRAGAGGKIGTQAAALLPADGYHIVLANTNTHVTLPIIDAKLGYEALGSFDPLCVATLTPLVLAASNAAPFKTVRELLDYGRANPGKLNYASTGQGSTQHLTGELFKSLTGIDMVHIGYKGAAPAHLELISGQVHLMFDLSVGALTKDGRVRGLATTGAARSPLYPDLPTLTEAGVPGVQVVGWNGFMLPKGTSRIVAEKLHQAITLALRDPDVQQKLAAAGMVAAVSTPEEMRKRIVDETAVFSDIVKRNKLKFD